MVANETPSGGAPGGDRRRNMPQIPPLPEGVEVPEGFPAMAMAMMAAMGAGLDPESEDGEALIQALLSSIHHGPDGTRRNIPSQPSVAPTGGLPADISAQMAGCPMRV
ncbi:hypothetical protein KIPB_000203 [Kipferlia bialata]|uniref:Uncharacterized protein n=1 Tax=Kipferlia bialata TaxID=797122 RepID=A0A9K3CLY6_9EUKA|nr:hypothetical protein KIPB_000203 [Kipferlia bialata]|eukprot:g203.t1